MTFSTKKIKAKYYIWLSIKPKRIAYHQPYVSYTYRYQTLKKINLNIMKDFLNLKNLKMGLACAAGIITYDYLAHGEIEWYRAIFISVFVVVGMAIINGLKK